MLESQDFSLSTVLSLGMESGDTQKGDDKEEEDEEKPETETSHDEEETRERSRESTIHTVPELLTEILKVP